MSTYTYTHTHMHEHAYDTHSHTSTIDMHASVHDKDGKWAHTMSQTERNGGRTSEKKTTLKRRKRRGRKNTHAHIHRAHKREKCIAS